MRNCGYGTILLAHWIKAASPEEPEVSLNPAWIVNSVYDFFASEERGGLLNHSTHKPQLESEEQPALLGQSSTIHSRVQHQDE